MKKIFVTILLLVVFPLSGVFCQENFYGSFALSSLDKNISLDLEGAQLMDVLKMLSQQTKLNFISTEAVRDRSLSLYMENVPLREAMDVIFEANNLAYDYYPDSSIFVVKEMGKPGIELKTKVYYLKYVRVKSSRMETEIEDIMAPEDESGGAATEEATGGGGEEADGIKGAVEMVLTEFGKVSEDPVTNSLIVIDVPSQFPHIDQVVSKLDIPMPRVMIEVEMLDVSKSRLDEIGFNFAGGATASYTPGSRGSMFPFEDLGFDRVLSSATAVEPGIALGTLSFASFTSVVKFLTQDISTKFIARPKILTLSNETAEVNITVSEVVGLTTTTTEGGNVTEEIERADTGTRLRVTPQVNPYSREITLVVEMFNRESIDSGFTLSSLGSAQLKNIEERATKNVVRLKEGETLFIGGLIKNEEKETITKIPFLGDIPIIGRFFRYVNRPASDNIERELLVFLTPRIMKEKSLLAKGKKILKREQTNSSKKKTMEVALDKFSR